MYIRLIRNATLQINYGGKNFLIDPIFAKKGTYPPIPSIKHANERNPLVELPVPVPELLDADAVVVTHLHNDHFDAEAKEALPKEIPLFVQDEADREKTLADGFQDVRVLDADSELGGVHLSKTGGQHGYVGEEDLKRLGNVCGVVLRAKGEGALYLAGDTIWNADVQCALERYHPDVIVVNAGANSIMDKQLIMGAEDVLAVHKAAPHAKLIAAHM
jgi:L-ascorbate metabolism protein UlaG (beta-lactamase superfamily)